MLKDIVINGIALKIDLIEASADRPTIIFLHHSLGSIDIWRDFPAKLGAATNCNVLVYDRQGYGQSGPLGEEPRTSAYLENEADILNALIEQCDINKAILFGHSDGGSIALIAGAKYPSRIIGIISEAAHIFVEEVTLQGIKDAVKAYETTKLKESLQKYHADKTDAIFWAWAGTWLNAEYRNWNIETFLRQIACPVLVIQGENDEYGSLEQVYGITNQVTGEASHFIIPKIGHTPHKEATRQVLDRVIDFINQLTNKA